MPADPPDLPINPPSSPFVSSGWSVKENLTAWSLFDLETDRSETTDLAGAK